MVMHCVVAQAVPAPCGVPPAPEQALVVMSAQDPLEKQHASVGTLQFAVAQLDPTPCAVPPLDAQFEGVGQGVGLQVLEQRRLSLHQHLELAQRFIFGDEQHISHLVHGRDPLPDVAALDFALGNVNPVFA